MHNELRAFLALCIYICIMCWKAIWKKNGKAVKGLRAAAETVELSEGTFWKFLHTTESCQNSCYLTPWLLYAYIYAQSEKAFNLQCKHSIVLTHVFFKKWTITTPEKIALSWLQWSPTLHPNKRSSCSKLTIEGGLLPYQMQFTAWANWTDGCCRGLCRSRAPPCQNCMCNLQCHSENIK